MHCENTTPFSVFTSAVGGATVTNGQREREGGQRRRQRRRRSSPEFSLVPFVRGEVSAAAAAAYEAVTTPERRRRERGKSFEWKMDGGMGGAGEGSPGGSIWFHGFFYASTHGLLEGFLGWKQNRDGIQAHGIILCCFLIPKI